MRFAFPHCYADPAFIECIHGAVDTPELLKQFDRLNGTNLSHRPSQDSMSAFIKFVHECVYLPLTDQALDSLRFQQAA